MALGMLRTTLGIPLKAVLAASYAALFLLAAFAPAPFVGVAFDSGGATTGPMTVPFILALGILFIPSFARVVRTQYAGIRDLNYIKSARLMGVRVPRILYAHILPNTLPVLVPAMTIGFNNAVLAEAGMSFLGIGIQPPQASLGSMLRDSQNYLTQAPWYALSTGFTMVLMILAFSLLSEGIQQRSSK